jgi:N utilization substance protein B
MAVQTLFHLGFFTKVCPEVFAVVQKEHAGKVSDNSVSYAQSLQDGVSAHKEKIDRLIASYAKGWDFSRLANVDLAIMRIAIYEMYFAKIKVEPGVAINEAVEIAKLYGDDDSPRFINGILGNLARTLTGADVAQDVSGD